jgi:hemoglobin/transferrin/lactoferrin receptor protein
MQDYTANYPLMLLPNLWFSAVSPCVRRWSFITRAGSFFRRISNVATTLLTISAMSVFPAVGHGQTLAAPGKPSRLDEMVITATRVEEAASDLPYATAALDRDMLDARSFRTMPDALREESSVMVQRTALGQGSPFIRGFTGFRTVLLVDGFRLNNAVFRDGPNQYWNTVDAWSLDKLELVKGPTSAQYGSDAVGGTVHARSIRPRIIASGPNWHGSALYRYASAEDSHVARIEAGGRVGESTAVIVGGSWKEFGDLRGGDDVGVQPHTGYTEDALDFKLEHRFTTHTRMTLAHQTVEQDDVWRTHATIHGLRWRGTVPGSNLIRALDQGRNLTYARLDGEGFADSLRSVHVGVAHHRQDEAEFRQRANLRIERAGFRVDTLGAFAHGRWETNAGRLVAGGEFYRDSVDSFLREFDANDMLTGVRVQGPVADDATHELLGVFAEDRVQLSPRLEATVGGRYNRTQIDAGKVAAPGTGNAFSMSSGTSSFAANARLLFAPDDARRWKLFAGASQGVRAPNLSDLTRFDIAEAGQIETPVNQLDPEKFLTMESGVRGEFGKLAMELVYYHTRIDDLIVRTPTGIIVAGLAEVTKRNSGTGHIHGVEMEAHAALTENFSARGVVSWMEGRLKSYPTAAPVLVEEPVSRLMPATFSGLLRWQKGPWSVGATVTLAAKMDKLATQDRVDTERIPPGGTPGYGVYGLHAGWRAGPRFKLSASVENLLNEDYRIHGSGLNEPGRNLVLTARTDF